MATILCVDDDLSVGQMLGSSLERAGHQSVQARTVSEATRLLARGGIDLIVADFQMQGAGGLELLGMLRRDDHEVPLIMLTGYASTAQAVASIRAGAVAYVTKPVRPEELELAVDQALEIARLRRDNRTLQDEAALHRNERQLVAHSAAMRHVVQSVAMAARTRAAVLLQGERGTGRTLLARTLHQLSERHDQPFIQLDLSALPEGLRESALLGQDHTPKTGEMGRVRGALERAHRGTLLLAGIPTLTLDLQAALMRVLREPEAMRDAGTTPVHVDVRLVTETSEDLLAAVSEGTVRQDLYHRLSVIPIVIPPLREHREDIPLLAIRFAEHAASEAAKTIDGFSREAMSYLESRSWPGNVRELQEAVERAVIVTQGTTIGIQAFDVAENIATPPPGTQTTGVLLSSLNIQDAERVLIQQALEATGGNRTKAAELLGISVRTLRNKLNTPGD